MPMIKLGLTGLAGVNKDLSQHELPDAPIAWTNCNNIRFLDGYAGQCWGYGEIYASPTIVPYHVSTCNVAGSRYILLAGSGKIHAVTGGTYTDLTRSAGGDYTGTRNNWTSTSLSGIPIFNDTVNVPQSWDLNIANKFTALANWPASTYCKSIRAYKNYLIALNITKTTTNYPFMVKWSTGADAGAVPSSWDQTDTTKDAGETDLAVGGDVIVDGMQLRNDFLIYKTNSIWRMTFVGGTYVFNFAPISNTQGALAKNCIVEMDGWHFVVGGSDIYMTDGQSVQSVLDKQSRRDFYASLDTDNYGRTFAFKNDFFNEICVCYPEAGSSIPNKMLAYNYKDKTVSYREIPNLNHACNGLVESSLQTTWSSDSLPWGSDVSGWNRPDFTPDTSRVVWASNDQKLYLMDGSAIHDGTLQTSYLERIGMSFNSPESIKLVKSVRPRIVGQIGGTVTISVGGTDDPYTTPTYTTTTHTIGSTVSDDLLVSGRYIALKISGDTAYQWRVDSIDMDVSAEGSW